ncbi:MAG: putative lipid II flippase FtsW [Candidatus Thiodiazotropha lotti]|uniref:putative lipid II flippase FtsW n=1 Tax=Candidatus Thiodiazotropha endoloripes TaxID=1818881 RepID=UPI00083E5D1D|nr:putative lipid II flippase FtsW [Candidatus Thiodiazotropha endoloripes]MCG7992898.1 putative lipid II flippase FtsW [Candidatus Thiodiazotropha lotti]MCW4184560.1 putative lipid II flippase FtsW [Candidatus Thiodiazotropha weberae]MCG7998963.1 putative lipid II flippase FtsW [Candidatus Thiodiazotropha lotti]MCW4190731.1 putative lipid II flippase FtsW [Candidatus Thiodiazotropha weberae]ODB83218.1 cell division protein FtsW [Candidatus Thiodiazotropha endoloripes]
MNNPRPQAMDARAAKPLEPTIDWWLLGASVLLLGFGLVMVASSSMTVGDRLAGSPFFYVYRHLFAMFLGLIGAALFFGIPMEQWRKAGPMLVFLGMFLLLIVLIPGVGKTVNGATRWVPLGVFNLQSSEFMKLFMVLYIAGYLVRRQDEVARSFWGFAKPMLLLIITSAMILLQPDFGTTVVLFATALGMLFLGGVVLYQFVTLILFSMVAGFALIFFTPYRWQRFTTFLNPWDDPFNTDFQLSQALIAFGRGEFTGVGLGNGIQKQFYLPEAHTDFIMAVVGEEFGLLGTLGIILLFAFITWRAFQIGVRAEAAGHRFSTYTAYGLGLWLGMQAFINIGVNVGMLPTKGLTLPFMSYGGNSIIVVCLMIALLLRIDYESRKSPDRDKKGRRSWSLM